jgi:hypothetical protein
LHRHERADDERHGHSSESYSQPVGTVPSLAGFTVRELHCLANEVAGLAAGLVVGQQLDQPA